MSEQLFAFILLLSSFYSVNESGCARKPSQKNLEKIEFDYEAISREGMLGGVMADYEFCIPRNLEHVDEIKSIEPDVLIAQASQGRIRCSREEYLCIVSTKDESWRDKLFRIAALDYVQRIIRTYYE